MIYRKTQYPNIPPIPPAPPDDAEDDADVPSVPDDTDDLDYKTPFPPPRKRKRDESDLSKAMDELNMVLMHIHGITPEEADERGRKG